MMLAPETLVRNLARASLLIISLVPALGYLFIEYSGSQHMASNDARIQAKRAAHVIAGNPDTWLYAPERVIDEIAEVRQENTHTLLTDTSGKTLMQIGTPCTGLCITGRAPLTLFDHMTGELIVKVDAATIFIRGSLIGGLGLVIGFLLMRLLNKHALVPLERIKLANFELAFFDTITQLPNRRLLLDRLQQAMASSSRSGKHGALLFIDLDNFKTLNDSLGHVYGDQLLKLVAQRLESCTRKNDTVASLGGDDFVMLAEGLSQFSFEAVVQTETIGKKISAALSQPYLLGTHEYRSTSSIGATLFNGMQTGIDDLMKQADIAMYQSKGSGRNALRFFDRPMQEKINARVALESELRKALNNRQFQLHYQIQVDSLLRPLGAEALIRWLHPERGFVYPAQFIPLAEETGMILPIGQWVLETACAQIKAWQQEPTMRGLVLAVNVSAGQFRTADFATHVQAAAKRHAINPGLLKLELTESMLLNNIEDTISKMNALKNIGVPISLDDFGTGYSSLQYLKRLPLDQLKIDQTFVRDLATDSSDKAIVRTIIAMAHSLNLDVIAEGVETEEQRKFLLDSGCNHYQGYLFGMPVPIEQFNAQMKQG